MVTLEASLADMETDTLLTYDEVNTHYNITRGTLWRAQQRQEIERRGTPGRALYRKSEIEAWLDRPRKVIRQTASIERDLRRPTSRLAWF